MAYRIDHERPNCIGCGACAALAPDHWIMDDDGKSNIVNGTKRADGCEEKQIGEDEYRDNLEAAECCPVNVIHLTDDKGEKII